MLRLIAKATSAPDAVADCRRHAAARSHVLQRYGIANITSANHAWWLNPATYALLLEDDATGEALGGVRLQRWGNGVSLPIEAALARVDLRVHAHVASFSRDGVGELCGLWCSPAVRGFGLGSRLTGMGIALASQVGTKTLFGICDTRQVTANLGLGFRVDRTLASAGTFAYPRPGLRAHVLIIEDALGLPGARPEARAAIAGYRTHTTGVDIVAVGGRRLELHRDLRLDAPVEETRCRPVLSALAERPRR